MAVDRHPRFLADVTGDGRADIVGFGDDDVWSSLSNGDGTLPATQFALAGFTTNAGGWRVDRHPRFLADVTGDGKADIVGFGDDGVWVVVEQRRRHLPATAVRARRLCPKRRRLAPRPAPETPRRRHR